ncbi:MAG: hypothetical protein GWP19_12340 [Planctomycetia bacterium]|nr:hypothetical protein [Planctomycetia bacterium]
MIPKVFLFLILIISFSSGQEIDSTKIKTPKNAALWSIFPGGGQIYNGKYLKAGILITLETLAVWQSIENGKKYKIENSNDIYITNRNKFAWWAFFVHIYGMLDAVVDSHLEPFNQIMEGEILDEETIEKEILPNG